MNNDLFRGKDGEKTVSPEQLDDYIHVSNPSAWIVLAAFAVLLVGICIWGVFGRLDTTIPVVAVRENDSIVCCIGEAAGSAIGLAVRDKCSVRDINVGELQRVLKDNGAYIGI